MPGTERTSIHVKRYSLSMLAPVRAEGTADTRVLPEHALRLKAAARDPGTQLWLVDGAGHTEAFKLHPDEYVRRVGDYFQARFR